MKAATCISVAVYLLSCSQSFASYTVAQWAFGVSVDDPPDDQSADRVIRTVTPSLHTTHSVSLPTPLPTVSTATYAVDWTPSQGDFLVQADQRAYDVSSLTLWSRATGIVQIVNIGIPIRLDVSAFYDYDLPPDAFVADLQFSVTGGLLFRSTQADSFSGHAVGRLSIQDSVVIPGDGIQRSVNYLMRIQSFAGHTGTVGVGSGNVHWTLTPLPEPSTAALLLPTSLILLRRKPRAR